ncbi:hypothetical protein [Labrys monachus]|uniref:Uncharacterized protein n=1 Tax=Labrys monachus TaxID=217067 RepID=A0ABU0F7W5_9HYPH|nr:hypothetical protein [Labrys monachus]MDQ0390702.1 hypothetical protein [Labrys monachus]
MEPFMCRYEELSKEDLLNEIRKKENMILMLSMEVDKTYLFDRASYDATKLFVKDAQDAWLMTFIFSSLFIMAGISTGLQVYSSTFISIVWLVHCLAQWRSDRHCP